MTRGVDDGNEVFGLILIVFGVFVLAISYGLYGSLRDFLYSSLSGGWFGYLFAVGAPLLAAIIWGTFTVPNDPSRSGSAPVAVRGIIRLLIELGFFFAAFWALLEMGYATTGWFFAIIVIIHYAISYDRIIWLLSKKVLKS